jgi:hypothetical protein
MSIFQTVCSDPLRQQVMVVLCIAVLQLHVCLLSQHLFSHAAQAVITEEPFASKIQIMANVFCIEYVAITVAQHITVIHMISLRALL